LECGDLTPLSFLLSLKIRWKMKKEGKKESGVKPPHSKMIFLITFPAPATTMR